MLEDEYKRRARDYVDNAVCCGTIKVVSLRIIEWDVTRSAKSPVDAEALNLGSRYMCVQGDGEYPTLYNNRPQNWLPTSASKTDPAMGRFAQLGLYRLLFRAISRG